MIVTWTVTPDDYVVIQKATMLWSAAYVRQRARIRRIACVAFSLAAGLVLLQDVLLHLLSARRGESPSWSGALEKLAILAGLGALGWWYLRRSGDLSRLERFELRRIRRSALDPTTKVPLPTQTLHAGDTSLVIQDQAGPRTEYPWTSVLGARELDGCLLIFVTEQSAIVVPRTAFANAAEFEAFTGFIRAHAASVDGLSALSA